MTNRERLGAALVALSLAGNAAAQGGHLTPLDDPRLQPVLRGTDAGPSDPRHFGGVPSRLIAGGRDGPSPYRQPSAYQIVSAGDGSSRLAEAVRVRVQGDTHHARPAANVLPSNTSPIGSRQR